MTEELSANRRALVQAAIGAGLVLGSSACASAQEAAQAAHGLRLSVRPTRVFKVPDLPRAGTEAWFALLTVESDEAVSPPRLTGLEVDYFSGSNLQASERFAAAAAEALAMRDAGPRAGVHRPLVFRLNCRQGAALMIDRVTCRLALETGVLSVEIPVGVYAQRTELIFPFRGEGIVTQGGAANGGHGNPSGQFAIDAMGLTSNYAVQAGAAFAVNTDLAGFGRELIAPAAGVVVFARGDRPDQPAPGESNEDYHLPELRGAGDPGNHVVIDHGNGEFSMIAHFMAGSLAVAQGQRVAQAQVIGRLGNSGDSFAPHVHYQLQDGPDRQTSNGLPCSFANVSRRWLNRGEFFQAS